jgi:hypothetical protein
MALNHDPIVIAFNINNIGVGVGLLMIIIQINTPIYLSRGGN